MFMVFQNYFTYFELSQSLHVGWAKSKDLFYKVQRDITKKCINKSYCSCALYGIL